MQPITVSLAFLGILADLGAGFPAGALFTAVLSDGFV